MENPKMYKSGEFAKKAHITKKTLRYYDEHNILKPSYVNENGARFYSDNDFAKLQQILFLKYLSFPLDDIKEMTIHNDDKDFWEESLKMQTNLITQKMEQLSLMKTAIEDAQQKIRDGENADWSSMLELVNSNEMEQMLKRQYQNSSNISARIHLHSDYSKNKQGWFPWLFEQAEYKESEKVLELGCGDASYWLENSTRIPEKISVLLTDISSGILLEADKKIEGLSGFESEVMDAHHINAADDSFDVVIANHMLFYCSDLDKVFSEIKRVLKPCGRLLCSTYSSKHMKEVSDLVKGFDDRIALAADELYDIFGKANGKQLLSKYFGDISWVQYEDELLIDKPEPLIAYILSCHGNQNRFIVDDYPEFYAYVKRQTDKGYKITKDSGVFVVKNS